jgi:hypothetical protein
MYHEHTQSKAANQKCLKVKILHHAYRLLSTQERQLSVAHKKTAAHGKENATASTRVSVQYLGLGEHLGHAAKRERKDRHNAHARRGRVARPHVRGQLGGEQSAQLLRRGRPSGCVADGRQ